MADPRIPDTALTKEEAAGMTQFVEKAPNHTYHIIERSKGDKEVALCRVDAPGRDGAPPQRDCMRIAHDVTKVFAFMQQQGFFCQLPFDPTHTEIECIRINKIVQRQS
ncbi:uncharacterized protein JCM10292_006198 [Rhodotorula paludigena]|uniref:uncharacterized protein n=1 Tax=Rhodotorula paludigena TaxID=86838 RepID=UPI00316DA5D8